MCRSERSVEECQVRWVAEELRSFVVTSNGGGVVVKYFLARARRDLGSPHITRWVGGAPTRPQCALSPFRKISVSRAKMGGTQENSCMPFLLFLRLGTI